jgi:hypothetical protein
LERSGSGTFDATRAEVEPIQKEPAMNAFEAHLLENWHECAALLARSDLAEFERRLDALVAILERCGDRTWVVATC